MPSSNIGSVLKRQVTREAKRLGAELVGFAPVSRWADWTGDAAPYRPDSIWPQAQTVVVLGVPILLPIIESTPSINYTELYNTTNRLLDEAAYRLATWLNGLGHASVNLPRDGYSSLEVLRRKPASSFSHVLAAKNAGLGTIGLSHLLITPEYGPRVRWVSIFTSAKLPGDPLLKRDLCSGCNLCARLCPAKALAKVKGQVIGRMDKTACTIRHQELRKAGCFPCGVCAKVCMVGDDRKLYGHTDARLYLREAQALAEDPAASDYQGWQQMRTHGSEPV